MYNAMVIVRNVKIEYFVSMNLVGSKSVLLESEQCKAVMKDIESLPF